MKTKAPLTAALALSDGERFPRTGSRIEPLNDDGLGVVEQCFQPVRQDRQDACPTTRFMEREKFSRVELWPLFRRYSQFCIVGGSGVAVDMAVIWLLADPRTLAWNLTLSKVVAAEVAIVNNFLWNDVWTFRGLGEERRGWLPRLSRFGKFNLICLAGIALSVLLLSFQVYGLGVRVYLANFLSIAAVSVWNFLMILKFGWKNGPRGNPQQSEPPTATGLG